MKGIHNVASQGALSAREIDNDTMRVFSRTRAYGSDYSRGKHDLHQTGSPLGYSQRETLASQDSLMRSVGFRDQETLKEDTHGLLGFSKAYGLDTGVSTDLYRSLYQKGAVDQGDFKELSRIMGGSIKANDMVGREDEQLRALTRIEDSLTRGRINVSSNEFKHLAQIQANLSEYNKNLRGDQGADFLEKASTLFDPMDERMLRLVGYGGDLGYGPEALLEAQKLLERGLTNPEALQNIVKNADKYIPGGFDSTTMRLLLTRSFGFSTDQSDSLIGAVNDGAFDEAINIASLDQTDDILKEDIEPSKVLSREQYELNREYSQQLVGDKLNHITDILKDIYNELSPTTQAGVTMAGEGLKWGATGFGAGALGKGVLNRLTGKGTKEVAKKGAASLLSTGALDVTKATHLTTGVTTALKAGTHGFRAYREYQEGNKRGTAGEVGAAVGTIGGGLAGAKIGATIGTAIAPGLGTAVGTVIGGGIGTAGAFLGGKFGRGVGETTYDLVTGEKKGFSTVSSAAEEEDPSSHEILTERKKEENLIKEERLIHFEEEVFETVLNEMKGLKDGSAFHSQAGRGKSLQDIQDKFNSLSSDAQGYISQRDAALGGGGMGGFALSSGGVAPAEGDYIGKVSKKYEVGERGNAGTISNTRGDYGGKSYGIPQFSTKTGSAKTFVNSLSGTNFGRFFQGAGNPGSASFDRAWKNAYNSDPTGFAHAQQSHAYKTFTETWMKQAKAKTGIDFSRSRMLQEAAFSTSIQNGPNSMNTLPRDLNPRMSDREIVTKIYNHKRDNVGTLFRSSSKSVQRAVANRYNRELPDLLALGDQPAIRAYAVGTDYVTHDQAAFLHKGEAVLPRHEATEYRQRRTDGGMGGEINLNITVNADPTGENREMIEKIKLAVEQAISQLQQNNEPINRSFVRKPV